MNRLLRRVLPDGLIGRAGLILFCGLFVSQFAAFVLFALNRMELTTRLDSRHIAERIAGDVQLVEEGSSTDRAALIHSLDSPGFRVGWGQHALVTERQDSEHNVAIDGQLTTRLPGHVVRNAYRPKEGPPAPGMAGLPPGSVMPPSEAGSAGLMTGPDPGTGMARGRPAVYLVSVTLSDGSWLNFALPAESNEPLWRWPFMTPLLAGNLVVLLLSLWAVRNGVKPLQLLAAAAERLGRDVGAPPLAVNGPTEVRAAATAFNRMQIRLRRFVEDRTQMVAAISHDLRTPITRLKLRAEFVEDDEQREKMLADLDEMETMIAATLSFARDDIVREPHQLFDLVPVLRDLCAQFGAEYLGVDHLSVLASMTGLKRAFANLLENARKYAGGCRVTLAATEERLTILLDDDGPGLPEDQLEQVFTAFYRVERSRNRETGGTGLGLTVTRSVLRAHGGDVVLSNRAHGGLRATVTLPL